MMRSVFLFLLFSVSLFASEFSEHIKFQKGTPNHIGHIYIGDHNESIRQATWIYVKNALDSYKESKPSFIILELNTPGGELYTSQKISDALKEIDIQYGIPVVAFINNWAISAGAMLAYSCRYIAIVKDASMGAAEPITSTGEKTSEKIHSAIRADFANRAAFFGRNPYIAEAMVDADTIVVLRDGNIIKISKEEEILSTDRIINRKGKLLTLNAKEMEEFKVADIILPPKSLVPITQPEKKVGSWPFSKELLSTAPFFSEISDATVESFQMDWKTKFFMFLSSPVVTSVLFLALMISIYVEMSTPGFGIPGTIAVIALFFIVLGSFSTQLISWLELIILLSGIALILIEIFVTPTFGIIGVFGIILAIGGLLLLLLPGLKDFRFDFDTNTVNAAGQYLLERIAYLSVTIILGAIIIAVLARYLVPKWQMFSSLVLRGEQEREVSPFKHLEVGNEGVVLSPLRPAGKVIIKEEVYDAVSSGKFLEKGVKVTVVGIEGSKIIVEEQE